MFEIYNENQRNVKVYYKMTMLLKVEYNQNGGTSTPWKEMGV